MKNGKLTQTRRGKEHRTEGVVKEKRETTFRENNRYHRRAITRALVTDHDANNDGTRRGEETVRCATGQSVGRH